jgi:hypothetical protein
MADDWNEKSNQRKEALYKNEKSIVRPELNEW